MANPNYNAMDLGFLSGKIDSLQEHTAKEIDLLQLELKLEKEASCRYREISRRIENNTRWAAAFVITGVIGQVALTAALIRFFGHLVIQQP